AGGAAVRADRELHQRRTAREDRGAAGGAGAVVGGAVPAGVERVGGAVPAEHAEPHAAAERGADGAAGCAGDVRAAAARGDVGAGAGLDHRSRRGVRGPVASIALVAPPIAVVSGGGGGDRGGAGRVGGSGEAAQAGGCGVLVP